MFVLIVLIITIVMFAGAHHVPQELCGLDGRAQGPEGDDCQRQRQAGVVQTGGLVDHYVEHQSTTYVVMKTRINSRVIADY